MEFQGRQQLADALDLSSRLAQREHQQKESSLFNALCDQSRFKTGEEEKEKDREEDWRQFLVRFWPLFHGTIIPQFETIFFVAISDFIAQHG